MKFDTKYKKITSIILMIIAISLILTGLILGKMMKDANAKTSNYWFFQESVTTGQPIKLENAYILSSDNGSIQFMHDFQTYEIKGTLAREYQGVADITISGEKIKKVSIKPDYINVVIKNGAGIFYENVYVQKVSDGIIVNASEYMQSNAVSVVEIADEQGLVLCDSQGIGLEPAYEGSFRIIRTEDGMVLVNELPIETYLKYVVPSEMPIAFGEEALKAQAVCARTYAYSQMNNTSYAMYAANLDDSTAFQTYHNAMRYVETDKAVDDTKGQVITSQGNLINCYYYSTSPGVTNDMSSWEAENSDYIACAGMEFSSGLNLQIASDFSKFIHQQNYCYDSTSPYYRWQAVLNTSVILDSSNGALKALSVKERNDAGYITAIELQYENGNVLLRNENEIRKVLGMYLEQTFLNDETVRNELTILPSACFEVVENAEGRIVLQGGGYGHGIGMSQYGAKAMAEAGFDYRAIIGYYYENVLVEELQ